MGDTLILKWQMMERFVVTSVQVWSVEEKFSYVTVWVCLILWLIKMHYLQIDHLRITEFSKLQRITAKYFVQCLFVFLIFLRTSSYWRSLSAPISLHWNSNSVIKLLRPSIKSSTKSLEFESVASATCSLIFLAIMFFLEHLLIRVLILYYINIRIYWYIVYNIMDDTHLSLWKHHPVKYFFVTFSNHF